MTEPARRGFIREALAQYVGDAPNLANLTSMADGGSEPLYTLIVNHRG